MLLHRCAARRLLAGEPRRSGPAMPDAGTRPADRWSAAGAGGRWLRPARDATLGRPRSRLDAGPLAASLAPGGIGRW